ncbi:hypothetical protein [Williamsia phyllosphaerae]|uniref:Uncharacterized protein n=1 Tax=Williamsia phyllosphaerae TaxID=885042 RepID=A0ABQ1U7K2_9NOCA|nr:hypothetical protein [Williamsia phyllosphaerae]GGF10756.1 hypothetical protein GCM10007298_03420 [Williamsia phyllosphaerae]
MSLQRESNVTTLTMGRPRSSITVGASTHVVRRTDDNDERCATRTELKICRSGLTRHVRRQKG